MRQFRRHHHLSVAPTLTIVFTSSRNILTFFVLFRSIQKPNLLSESRSFIIVDIKSQSLLNFKREQRKTKYIRSEVDTDYIHLFGRK
jgi:hypothetical protein